MPLSFPLPAKSCTISKTVELRIVKILKPCWVSLAAQLVKNLPECRRPQLDPWVRKILWRRDRLPTPVFLGFPGGSAGKESACNVGDLGSIPGLGNLGSILGLGRSPGERKGYPLQYSGLESSMDCIIHGVTKRGTWLNDFHFHADSTKTSLLF